MEYFTKNITKTGGGVVTQLHNKQINTVFFINYFFLLLMSVTPERDTKIPLNKPHEIQIEN